MAVRDHMWIWIPPIWPIFKKTIDEDSTGQENHTYTLSLDGAISMGLRQNLDLELSALETLAASNRVTLQKLEAIPSVEAKVNYIGRSNRGASSSQSVITGNQSLEPSVSTEQDRQTRELEASWNLLNATLAVVRSKTASDQEKAAAERQRKAAQDLSQDIIIAYHRALAAQNNLEQIDALKDAADRQLTNTDIAISERWVSMDLGTQNYDQILSRITQFDQTAEAIEIADLELKALLKISPKTDLTLEKTTDFDNPLRRLPARMNIAALENYALRNRPEMREQLLNQNIALRNKRLAVMETFPGASVIWTYHRDSNKFIE
jgi:outer membrane protein TolC